MYIHTHSIPLGVLLMTVSLDGKRRAGLRMVDNVSIIPGGRRRNPGDYWTLAPFGQLGGRKLRPKCSPPREEVLPERALPCANRQL
jgi:hypothetical protein